ncbi:MAG: hypothetical protein ACSHYB_10755 [Roseibacillus sp.]
MSLNLKCAACGHQVPFQDGDLETEAICPGCEVLLRRRSLEDQMAIPVSMALPDQFEPADLGRVPKHSQELIHRYQKNIASRVVKTGDPLSDSNHALARAIEHLALAIETSGFDHKSFDRAEGYLTPDESAEDFSEGQNQVPVLNGQNGSGERSSLPEANGRAEPIGSPVLVRREAAAEAHRFQRQTQAATDIKGPQKTAVTNWIEKHPISMLLAGLALLIALVVMTTILMDRSFTNSDEVRPAASTMSQGNQAEDPDFYHAEREARGFLNAIALNPAKPYIFRANEIGPKLEKFFLPLPNPADYELKLTGRQKNENKAVYYYQVTCGDLTQPLVVLQENQLFKVFWEFGACVGDISWEAFVDEEPKTPVLMRAFLKPDTVFDSVHDQAKWSSWLAENWDGSHSARVFVKLGSPEYRRLTSALEEYPVKRHQANWVMAQVRLKHMGTGVDRLAGAFESADVIEVPLGSWLPEEFVVGDTFYSERDKLDGSPKDLQGLQKRN